VFDIEQKMPVLTMTRIGGHFMSFEMMKDVKDSGKMFVLFRVTKQG